MKLDFPFEIIADFFEIISRFDGYSVDITRFFGIFFGNDYFLYSVFPRGNENGQNAVYPADVPVERKLAYENGLDVASQNFAVCRYYTYGYRQIKPRALFF